MHVPLLVSTEWLAGRLGDSGVRMVDVRWSLLEKDKGRNAYLQGHLPGAVFMDVDGDLASPRGRCACTRSTAPSPGSRTRIRPGS